MATLSVQQITEAGLEASYAAAAAGGDTFVNDGSGRIFLHVKNGHATNPRTVTVTPSTGTTSKAGFGALTKAPIVVAITALEQRFIGPLPSPAFAEPAITYSDSAADVTIAVVKI